MQSFKMTEALIAPVYKDSKSTKQLGSAAIPDFGWGHPPPKAKSSSTSSSSATHAHRLIDVLKLVVLPLAKQPILHRKHMWTIQWDG